MFLPPRTGGHESRSGALGASNKYLTELFLPADRIVAVGLLTQRDVNLLGPTFERLWPVEEAPGFSALLRAVDDADREFKRREREALGED